MKRVQRSTLYRCALVIACVLIVAICIRRDQGANAKDGAVLRAEVDADISNETLLRRPVALGLINEEQLLISLNQQSGSISSIDTESMGVVREQVIGTKPSDMHVFAGRNEVAVVDQEEHALSIWRWHEGAFAEIDRIDVAKYPVQVIATSDGSQLIVASLWSRRLTIVDRSADEGGALQFNRYVDLPFAPREMELLKDDCRLFVADAYGGRLMLYDLEEHATISEIDVPGHNIRGLSTTPDERMLIISHQMLNELAHTVRNDVHWGLLMSNDLRWLKIDALQTSEGNLYEDAHMHPLGQAGNAAGDPAGVCMTTQGTVVVALGGVDEVAVGREEDFSLLRLDVGQRPTAVIANQEGSTAYVANTFGESISVVDLDDREVVKQIELGATPELSLAQQGELLFHDAKFSHDSWMSCNSCHTDGHTNGLLNDNFTDMSFGAPKRVLSLLGKAQTLPLAWDGSVPDFESQVRSSIKSTMQSDHAPDDESVAAIAAFLTTLPAPPALDVARDTADPEKVAAGAELFSQLGCIACHEPPSYTSPDVYDVGLVDKMGQNTFNPPSLLGVSQRTAYFHDNRAKSLRDVVVEYRHRLPRELSEEEIDLLLSFLRSI